MTGNRATHLIWSRCSGKESDNWQAQSKWLKRALKALPKPLAVFCYCDYDAAKVEAVCLEAGYAVPDDVAILGVDNDALVCENIRVPLSSVRHDLARIGYEGAALLDRLMTAGAPGQTGAHPPARRGAESQHRQPHARGSAGPRGHALFPREPRQEHRRRRRCAGRERPPPQAGGALRPRAGQTVYATLLNLRVFEVKRLLTLTIYP
jgi:hypothetical protein